MTADPFKILMRYPLDSAHHVFVGRIPDALLPSAAEFDALWNLHPIEFGTIAMHGKSVRLPRWQQAYGRDYRFSGKTAEAHAIPPVLEPYLAWARSAFDGRLNGLLLNWYDGSLGHYIGKHRDEHRGIVRDTAFLTISLGETRTFRLRQWRGDEQVDVKAENGTLIAIPFDTNKQWTHEITKSAKAKGRRISITIRAFT